MDNNTTLEAQPTTPQLLRMLYRRNAWFLVPACIFLAGNVTGYAVGQRGARAPAPPAPVAAQAPRPEPPAKLAAKPAPASPKAQASKKPLAKKDKSIAKR